MEVGLNKTEDIKALIVDNILERVVYHAPDLKIIWANQSAVRSVSSSLGEITGQYCYEVWQKRQQPCEKCPVLNALTSGKTETGEVRTPEGVIWRLMAYPIKDENGKVIGIAEVGYDITVIRKAEEVLVESEARYQALFERGLHCIYVHDLQGNFLDANGAALKLTGYTREELSTIRISDLISEDQLALARQITAEIVQKGAVSTPTEYRLKHKDGTYVWIETEATLLTREGKPYAIQGIARDITERKQQEKLQYSIYRIADAAHQAEKLDDLFVSIHNIISYLMPAKNFYIALYDRTLDQISFPYFVDQLEDKPGVRRSGRGLTEYVIRTGKPLLASKEMMDELVQEGEIEIIGRNSVDWLGVPLVTKTGTIGVLALQSYEDKVRFTSKNVFILRFVSEQIAMSIERKMAEDALAESERKYKSITENVHVGIYRNTADPEGRFIEINPAIVRILGYQNRNELMKTRVIDHYCNPEDRSHMREKLIRQGAIKDEELFLRRKDGGTFIASVSAIGVKDDNGSIVYYDGVLEDITERRNAEQKLRESYEKLRRVLNGTVHALASTTEKRDPYTAGHQQRVAQLACAIAQEMSMSVSDIEGIRVAGIVHDIGKIYVAAEILNKPITLKDIEMELIKTHCQAGYEILRTVDFPWPVAETVLQHHEKMDGSGYPRGLKSNAIMMSARILAVADVVEAMVSHRPYRSALSMEEAIDEITENRNRLYDTAVVDACIRVFNKGFQFK